MGSDWEPKDWSRNCSDHFVGDWLRFTFQSLTDHWWVKAVCMLTHACSPGLAVAMGLNDLTGWTLSALMLPNPHLQRVTAIFTYDWRSPCLQIILPQKKKPIYFNNWGKKFFEDEIFASIYVQKNILPIKYKSLKGSVHHHAPSCHFQVTRLPSPARLPKSKCKHACKHNFKEQKVMVYDGLYPWR